MKGRSPFCWIAAIVSAATLASGGPPREGIPAAATVSNIPLPAATADLHPWISSASGIFRARGAKNTTLIPLLSWCDHAARRLETFLGDRLPRMTASPVFLELDTRAEPTASFRRSHLVRDWGVAQRLEITNIDRADPEETLRQLTQILLDRYAVGRQTPEQRRTSPATVPPGLGAGVARALFPEARERALQSARESWINGADADLARLVGLAFFPEPAEIDRCAAAVVFLTEPPGGSRVLRNLLEEAAQGRPVTAVRLAQTLGMDHPRTLARAWALWMAATDQRQTPWTQPVELRIRRIREAASLDRALWPNPLPADAPERIDAQVLLQRRAEPWTRGVAAVLAGRLRAIPTGDIPKVRDAVDALRQALLDLSSPPATPPWSWLPHPTSSRSIGARIRAAEAALEEQRVWALAAEEAGRQLLVERTPPARPPAPPATTGPDRP